MRRLLLALAVTLSASSLTGCAEEPVVSEIRYEDESRWPMAILSEYLEQERLAAKQSYSWVRGMPWISALPVLASVSDPS